MNQNELLKLIARQLIGIEKVDLTDTEKSIAAILVRGGYLIITEGPNFVLGSNK